MAQRKIPYLKVVEPPENPKQLKKAERKVRWLLHLFLKYWEKINSEVKEIIVYNGDNIQ